jgi:hypothetical protein
VLRDECLDLADELGVPAEFEAGLDPPLDRGQAKLFELPDRGLRKRLVGDLGERRSAPEAERVAQECRRSRRLRRCRLLDELLEAVHVELASPHLEQVAGRPRYDTRSRRPERLAKMRDAHVEGGRARGRRLVGPEGVDEAIGRDDLVRVQEQNRE